MNVVVLDMPAIGTWDLIVPAGDWNFTTDAGIQLRSGGELRIVGSAQVKKIHGRFGRREAFAARIRWHSETEEAYRVRAAVVYRSRCEQDKATA